jgi:hypothetical protein
VVALEDLGGLDALPCGGDFDEDAILGDALLLVEVDDVQSLVDGAFDVEGQAGVDLGGDLAGNNLEDLLAELNKKTVEGNLNLLIGRAALRFGVCDGLVNQRGIFSLLGRGEDEGGVRRGILRLVLADSCVNCELFGPDKTFLIRREMVWSPMEGRAEGEVAMGVAMGVAMRSGEIDVQAKSPRRS